MLKAGDFTIVELENVQITIGTVVNTFESVTDEAKERNGAKRSLPEKTGPTPMPGRWRLGSGGLDAKEFEG